MLVFIANVTRNITICLCFALCIHFEKKPFGSKLLLEHVLETLNEENYTSNFVDDIAGVRPNEK